jgi:hypothetical protein
MKLHQGRNQLARVRASDKQHALHARIPQLQTHPHSFEGKNGPIKISGGKNG